MAATFSCTARRSSLFSGQGAGLSALARGGFRRTAGDAVMSTRNVILPRLLAGEYSVVRDGGWALVQDTTTSSMTNRSAPPDGPRAFAIRPRATVVSRPAWTCFGDEWLVIPGDALSLENNEDWIYGEFGADIGRPTTRPRRTICHREEELVSGCKGAVPNAGGQRGYDSGVEAAYEAFLRPMTEHSALSMLCAGDGRRGRFFALNGPLYAHLSARPRRADG